MFRVEKFRAFIRRAAFTMVTAGVFILAAHGRAADESVSEMQAAAAKGFVPEQIKLASAYFAGEGIERDERMAAYWYEQAARNGDPEAANEIGYFYQAGIGVKQDIERARHWYQLSAASGFTNAKVNLGVLYLRGHGVKKSEEMAMQLFQEAAEKGNGTAATYLGDMCYFGLGIAQDKSEAEKWYAAGVRMHDPVAAYNLGTLYSLKDDHVRDLPKAGSLLRESASAGYVPAMHSLGLPIVQHPELGKTADEARNLLQAASNAGLWRSTVVLGLLARDGRGMPADPEAAYHKFRIAVLQGGAEAQRLLANDIAVLTKKLTAEHAASLDAAAETWSHQHPTARSLFVESMRDGAARFPVLPRAIADDGAPAPQGSAPPT